MDVSHCCRKQDILKKPTTPLLFWGLVVLVICQEIAPADEYAERRARIQARGRLPRTVPEIPPKDQRLRVIIDTDARNEIDDIWAIALAISCPERFQIEGFVAANYDNRNPGGGPNSVETSAQAIATVLDKAGLAGKIPIRHGSSPMRYQFEPSDSEGVDFIIEKSMSSTPEDPLWIIGLGAATDIASAYLKEPRIAERIRVFWHFRTRWPKQCWNFNVIGDVRAARLVFHSDLPFVLFDTGTYLHCPMEESETWQSYSPLARYLHQFRFEQEWYQSPKKGFYDVGDIAALIDPDVTSWEVVECPEVDWDLTYRFRGTRGKILRCFDIDRDRTFALMNRKLRQNRNQ
jgi:inosine-uridine nucleoside N-ribohydrolase